MCFYPEATNSTLLPLPLGPKWQWRSKEFDREPKVEIKQRIVDAGSKDPRSLFNKKQKMVYVALTVTTTDSPFYLKNKNIRQKFIDQMNSTGMFPCTDNNSQFLTVVGPHSHTQYLDIVAKSAFVISPPGE